ncbi:MAG: hypothetical protein ACK5QK_08435 [Chryseotalea sp.]|jgi:hypothetical protein|nr:hypothetical protein [Cytophagales bacterium]
MFLYDFSLQALYAILLLYAIPIPYNAQLELYFDKPLLISFSDQQLFNRIYFKAKPE